MEEFIKECLIKNNFKYIPIPDIHLANIHALFHDGNNNEIENDVVLLYYGIYCEITNNYDVMKQYYSRAIDYGNVDAMFCMAMYYNKTGDGTHGSIRYELHVIEGGGVPNLFWDFAQFLYLDNDFHNTVKYYLMAINHGHIKSMNYLAWRYYRNRDFDNTVKYYLMAINHGDIKSVYQLACCYYEMDKHDNAMMYFNMALDYNHHDSGHITDFIGDCVDEDTGILMDGLIVTVNKMLGLISGDELLDVLQEAQLTHDIINVFINIDKTKCKNYNMFHLLP